MLRIRFIGFRSHSLRRGGAAALLPAGVPILNIMSFGRWKPLTAVRVYLKTGEVYIFRLPQHVPASVWENVDYLALPMPNIMIKTWPPLP